MSESLDIRATYTLQYMPPFDLHLHSIVNTAVNAKEGKACICISHHVLTSRFHFLRHLALLR
jgi:hypothetical protein